MRGYNNSDQAVLFVVKAELEILIHISHRIVMLEIGPVPAGITTIHLVLVLRYTHFLCSQSFKPETAFVMVLISEGKLHNMDLVKNSHM